MQNNLFFLPVGTEYFLMISAQIDEQAKSILNCIICSFTLQRIDAIILKEITKGSQSIMIPWVLLSLEKNVSSTYKPVQSMQSPVFQICSQTGPPGTNPMDQLNSWRTKNLKTQNIRGWERQNNQWKEIFIAVRIHFQNRSMCARA